MFTFPNQRKATSLRQMMRVHGPAEVESVARHQTRNGEFANLIYRSPAEYDAIIEWLTEPTSDFRVLLEYAGETNTRVGVKLASQTTEEI